MKRLLSLMTVALIVVATVLPAQAKYKEQYKLSVVPGAASGWGKSAQYFADLVRERSEGRINIKCYFSSQLLAGKQTSEFLMLRNGAIDFAMASTINWSPQIKALNLTALPFFLASQKDRYKALDAIKAGKSGAMMFKAIEKKGVKPFGWAENGFRELTNSKRAVAAPADLKDLKIRVVGSPIFIDTFKALGANPVNMNWAEATTGFQQGVVDGQENPTNGINIPVKIWNYHKYITEWHYIIDPLITAANPRVWKKFSKEDQQLLKDCAGLAEEYSKSISRVGLDDGTALSYLTAINKVPSPSDPLQFLREKGMTVIQLTPEQIGAFYKATAGVREEWIPRIGKELVEAAKADIATVQ